MPASYKKRLDQPRTSLAGILIAVTAISLALGFWINAPFLPFPMPLAPLFAGFVFAFVGALVTPMRWPGVLIGCLVVAGWASDWSLPKSVAEGLAALIFIGLFPVPPLILAAVAGSVLRYRLSVKDDTPLFDDPPFKRDDDEISD